MKIYLCMSMLKGVYLWIAFLGNVQYVTKKYICIIEIYQTMFIKQKKDRVLNINVVIPVIWRKLGIMEYQKEELHRKALDIMSFNDNIVKGGNAKKHKTSIFGKILKFIFAERNWSFEDVGNFLCMTPQNINYIVNRMDEKSFNVIYVSELCRKLQIDIDFFYGLYNEIKEIEKLDERKGK